MFWSSPPVPSKHVVREEVQVPPAAGVPATSLPSGPPPTTASRWAVQAAAIELPTADTMMYSPQNGTRRPPNCSRLGLVSADVSSWCDQVAPPSFDLEYQTPRHALPAPVSLLQGDLVAE